MVVKLRKKKFDRVLVTSAWPYIHGMPHLGNIVGSLLPADVFVRYCRLKGHKTIYVTGSDAHGTPTEIAAFKEGITPRELAYRNHEIVKKLFEQWGFSFDNYSITDSEINKATTYNIFERLWKNDCIVEEEMEQAYCEECKRFLPDRWIEGECPHCKGLGRGDQCNDCGRVLDAHQLIKPYCIICKEKKIVFKKTKHLFINLPKFQKDIIKLVNKHPEWPENAKKFTLEFVKNIQKRPITRDIKWGFSVPLPWYKNKVFYVWFDAVLGYISATKEWCIKNKENWEDWWKNPKTRVVQTLAKDNLVFHTIIWPSILIGTEDGYILPDHIASCEYLITKGIKFSKSRGVGITIEEIFNFRPVDYWRYTLMALYPQTRDTDFSLEEFQRRVNTELADTIGNFIHRSLTFIKNNYKDSIPDPIRKDAVDEKIIKKAELTVKKFEKYFEEVRFREVLNEIYSLAVACNVYLNKKEPWHTIKKNPNKAKTTLYICANLCAILSVLLEPFIPFSSAEIRKQLKFKFKNLDDIKEFGILKPKHKIGSIKPLFKKIENKELEIWRQKFREDNQSSLAT